MCGLKRWTAASSASSGAWTALDEKMTRYFVWLVGIQVTTLAAIVAAFAGRG